MYCILNKTSRLVLNHLHGIEALNDYFILSFNVSQELQVNTQYYLEGTCNKVVNVLDHFLCAEEGVY